MSILFLSFSLVIVVVHSAPYNCSSKYTPLNYTGFLRVPTNCSVKSPSSCPRSWKSGIPEGRANTSTEPLIYSEFITCHEGFASCGYVPINPKTGNVLGKSGVTIGAGVDLGSKSTNSSVFNSLPTFLVDKLEPYFGLRQDLAACVAIEQPLNLSSSEASNLTIAVEESVTKTVAKRYDEDKEEKALPFVSLPRGIRTAIVSVWFQFGFPDAYPNFWEFVKKNDWQKAAKELRNFYKNPDEQLKGDLRRRNNEADIIEASFVECDRSLDAVILLDESASVSWYSFLQSLYFVKNLIKAFPDARLRGDDGTRFALSTFSYYYRHRFRLSSYKSQSEYISAIDNVVQNGGRTRLGRALKYILTDQFTEAGGLRSEEHGIPRVLIVLTDGVSHDEVTYAAQRLRDENIVIYAIGVGDYDRPQLEDVASSTSHVYTLSTFFELETFVATLTAATCNEPQPISLNKEVKSTVKKDKYQYFLYNVDNNSYLKITVNDLSGQTIVYASRSNRHPYKYDNDVSFDTSFQKNKVLVISPKEPSGIMKSIYISVTTNTDNALFTIEGKKCNSLRSLDCNEGTNEPKPIPLNKTVQSTTKKDHYRSFVFNIDTNLNLKITIKDLVGESLVYASRSNPQPSINENDLSFSFAYQKNKILVISPKVTSIKKRAAGSKDTKLIYISVTADTVNTLFTIKGDTCIPSVNCTEGTTYEPQPLDKTINSTTKKNEYQYFYFDVDINSNLKITVTDFSGETMVYASRSNTRPSKQDNDLHFDTHPFQKYKVLTISPKPSNKKSKKSIYISVTADTKIASFSIEGSICNPLKCKEGTNEMVFVVDKVNNSSFKNCGLLFLIFFAVTLSLSLT